MTTIERTPTNRHYIKNLSGFHRPEHRATFLNDAGNVVGQLDLDWSMDMIVWSDWRKGKAIARSNSWTELMAQLMPLQ